MQFLMLVCRDTEPVPPAAGPAGDVDGVMEIRPVWAG